MRKGAGPQSDCGEAGGGKNQSTDEKNYRGERKVGKRQTSQNEVEEEEKRNRCWKWQPEESQRSDSQTKTREMDHQTGNREKILCSGNGQII